jgi:hypothetical protein
VSRGSAVAREEAGVTPKKMNSSPPWNSSSEKKKEIRETTNG